MTASGVPADLPRLVRAAADVLSEAGVASPRHDAEVLAAHALGFDRLNLVLPPPVPAGFTRTYSDLVERRRLREPLQHITGQAAFRYLDLRVLPGVFVPRPETEVVAGAAIEAAREAREAIVVDLCTGTGAIAVSVATEVPGSRVWAVDLNGAATDLTTTNARAADARLTVLRGDVRDPALLEELSGRCDVVVSNPPYIPPDALPTEAEVRQHDPDLALYGGGVDGLTLPAAVVAAAARLLRPGGQLVMEHSDVQGPAARELASRDGAFTDIVTRTDLTGRDRMLLARRS